MDVWTIGHSTRSIDEFVALLEAAGIEAVADVRRHAGSRKYPHFNPEPLARALADHGIEYHAFVDLGGRRKTRPDSPNTVWRNASFRGYADYMETEPFKAALARLTELAHAKRTALLCAEAVWWRCHRALISDALKARGDAVHHILGEEKIQDHPYTSAARVVDVMDPDVEPIRATASAEEVAREFQDRDLIVAPVVDDNGRLVGQITVDDVAQSYLDMLEVHSADFARVVRLVLEGQPALFHCTAGKDRTGLLALLLLEVAGVDTEDIVEDFALTHDRIGPLRERQLTEAEKNGVSREQFSRLLGATPDMIEPAIEYLHERYGGAEKYLKLHGVTDEDIELVRRKLTD